MNFKGIKLQYSLVEFTVTMNPPLCKTMQLLDSLLNKKEDWVYLNVNKCNLNTFFNNPMWVN